MALEVFDGAPKKDAEYQAWMDLNRDGYVGNLGQGKDSAYFVLHQAGCHHISKYSRSSRKDSFTTGQYLKVCSTDIQDLISWARTYRPATPGPTPCKTCNPLYIDSDPVEVQITNDLAALELENEYFEGVKKSRLSNFYERNPKLRLAAIKVHGLICKVCGFDFNNAYGNHGMGFIEVHHLKLVSKLERSTKVCPEKDMTVVCSNCHRMLHRNREILLTPEQLKQFLTSK